MTERRDLLKLAGAAAAALSIPAVAVAQPARPLRTPAEDLMQEHGLVARVAEAARIVSRVIHGHHEREEEQTIFPALDDSPARGLAGPMRQFIEMYEPHGAFENTVAASWTMSQRWGASRTRSASGSRVHRPAAGATPLLSAL